MAVDLHDAVPYSRRPDLESEQLGDLFVLAQSVSCWERYTYQQIMLISATGANWCQLVPTDATHIRNSAKCKQRDYNDG